MVELTIPGWLTVAQAAARRGWVKRTLQRWIEKGLIPVAVVGEGRNRKHMLREADVDAFVLPQKGAPKGNQNARKNRPKKSQKKNPNP